MTAEKEASSYRDPSGFVFLRGKTLFRQVNRSYGDEYDLLMKSGLYGELVGEGLMIPHEEVGDPAAEPESAYKIIKPHAVPFISYPYEWCFGQLRDAALTTLRIQKKAFRFGMCLKDASAYNIQFYKGTPILIDTLSFEKYRKGEPWIAYRQFCQHFLAPLALMSRRDARFNQLLKSYVDGIPLDFASALLPFRTRFSFSLLTHVHMHAKSQKKHGGKAVEVGKAAISPFALSAIIESLSTCVEKMNWKAAGTAWAGYYESTNYTDEAFREKQRIVDGLIAEAAPRTVWDLGANCGVFSRLASARKIETVAFDMDPAAVELNYRTCRRSNDEHLLPLLSDLTNPSPGIGWECEERKSLLERGPADLALALALVHHLAISNNTPFPMICGLLRKIGKRLVIEFIPKSDSQVMRLLASREDVFPWYTVQEFEREFSRHFTLEKKIPIPQSDRILYLMSTK
jgi:ribosomal protein L11 methylase PrmA